MQDGDGSSGLESTDCPTADVDPRMDEIRCPDPSEASVYLTADRRQVSLDGTIEFTFHNGSADPISTNPHDRGLYRHEDNDWTIHSAPSAIPAYVSGIDPGSSASWTVSFGDSTERDADDPHEVTYADVSPGVYAFRTTEDVDIDRNVGYAKRFEVVE